MATKRAMSNEAFASVYEFISGRSKLAEGTEDPGGREGPTTHPVKNVDNNNIEAVEGKQTRLNTQKVKEEIGDASVDATPDAKAAMLRLRKAAEGIMAGSAEDAQYQIGTKKTIQGNHPSVETSSAKAKKEDKQRMGSSTHPARADNDELSSGKYAEFNAAVNAFKNAGFRLGTLLTYGVLPNETEKATEKAASLGNSNEHLPADLVEQLGWEAAALATGTMTKEAAEYLVRQRLYDVVKTASATAQMTYELLQRQNALEQIIAEEELKKTANLQEAAALAAMEGGEVNPENGDVDSIPPELLAAIQEQIDNDNAAQTGQAATQMPSGQTQPETVDEIPPELIAALEEQAQNDSGGGDDTEQNVNDEEAVNKLVTMLEAMKAQEAQDEAAAANADGIILPEELPGGKTASYQKKTAQKAKSAQVVEESLKRLYEMIAKSKR